MEKEGRFIYDWHSVQSLLHNETQNGHHGDSSVLEFLGLHFDLRLFVFGEQSERIKIAVARYVLDVIGTGAHFFTVPFFFGAR